MKFNKPGNASVLEEQCTESMGRKTREEFTIDPIVFFFNIQNKRARNLVWDVGSRAIIRRTSSIFRKKASHNCFILRLKIFMNTIFGYGIRRRK
jgi:hypothetical protein